MHTKNVGRRAWCALIINLNDLTVLKIVDRALLFRFLINFTVGNINVIWDDKNVNRNNGNGCSEDSYPEQYEMAQRAHEYQHHYNNSSNSSNYSSESYISGDSPPSPDPYYSKHAQR